MNNCIDCQHFKAPKAEYEKGWGECLRGRSHDGTPDDKSTLAVGSDYEGYMASIEVRPNFGCIQFEAKPIG